MAMCCGALAVRDPNFFPVSRFPESEMGKGHGRIQACEFFSRAVLIRALLKSGSRRCENSSQVVV